MTRSKTNRSINKSINQCKYLVASLVVTGPHVDRFVVVVIVHGTVYTHRLGFAANLSRNRYTHVISQETLSTLSDLGVVLLCL